MDHTNQPLRRNNSFRALHAAYGNFNRYKSHGRRVGDAAARVEVDRFMNIESTDRSRQAMRLGARIFNTPVADLTAPGSIAFSIKDNLEAHIPGFSELYDAVDHQDKALGSGGMAYNFVKQMEDLIKQQTLLPVETQEAFQIIRQAFLSIPMAVFTTLFYYPRLTEDERVLYTSMHLTSPLRRFNELTTANGIGEQSRLFFEAARFLQSGGDIQSFPTTLSLEDQEKAKTLGEALELRADLALMFDAMPVSPGQGFAELSYKIACEQTLIAIAPMDVESLLAYVKTPAVIALRSKLRSLLPAYQRELIVPFQTGITAWYQAGLSAGEFRSCAIGHRNP